MTAPESRYVLATGEEANYRLQIVNRVHGPDTENFLRRAGLAAGMRVADIGCGVGAVTTWIAEQAGPGGQVSAVDISPGQVEEARRAAAGAGLTNIDFHVASAAEPGLPTGAYDLVFCRFVLMHVPHPEAALYAMRDLLKPGGVLACEDGDFTAPFCEPPSPAFNRTFELYRAIGERRGLDFHVGPKLYGMFREAGFPRPEVALAQPAVVRGDAKRLPEWTLTEAEEAIVEAGLADAEEIRQVAAEMAALAQDDSVLFGMTRMTQVWARRP